MRGVRWFYDREEEDIRLDIYSDGVVDFGFRLGPRRSNREGLLISVSWVIAYATKVLLTANKLRTITGFADGEYAFEMELDTSSNSPLLESVQIMGFQSYSSVDSGIGAPLSRLPLLLPRMSFGPIEEMDHLLSSLVTDLYDAAGNGQGDPVSLQVQLT